MRRMGEDRVSFIRLGPLQVWLARADKEWGYAVKHGEMSTVVDHAKVPSDVVPKDLEWVTTVFESAPMDYELRPAVPNRPLVFRPLHPVRIPRGQRGTFYALIPVFMELVIHGKGTEFSMGKVPSQKLSDTWFGNYARGDLSYSIPMAAQRDLQAVETFPHQIVCPVEVSNASKEELFFEKFCLRPKHLMLFAGAKHLWSSRVKVTHEGAFHSSAVRYEDTAPDYEEGVTLVAKAAEKLEKRLQWLTFGSSFQGDFITAR